MLYIDCPSDSYKKFTFPAGELHIIIPETWVYDDVQITFNFSRSEDIFELMLLADTLKRNNCTIQHLVLPYCPFGQADRVNESGECFSLRLFADLVNKIIRPREVVVWDAHSPVTTALLNNCVEVPQHHLLHSVVGGIVDKHDNVIFISPDAGSSKKIYKLSQLFNVAYVQCEKIRCTKTGNILETKVPFDRCDGLTCLIVDDICVGGRTYIEIAKVLREKNASKIILVTTRGLYSNGVAIFDGLIDEIWTKDRRVK